MHNQNSVSSFVHCRTSTRINLNLLNVRIGATIKKDVVNNLLCPVWLRDQPRSQGLFPGLGTRLLRD